MPLVATYPKKRQYSKKKKYCLLRPSKPSSDEKNIFGNNKLTKKKCAKLPLPPVLPQNRGKMTVVLDMDETLIHSIFLKDIADHIPGNTKKRNKSIHTLDEPMIIWRLKQEADMILDVYGGVAVFLRPGVHRFFISFLRYVKLFSGRLPKKSMQKRYCTILILTKNLFQFITDSIGMILLKLMTKNV